MIFLNLLFIFICFFNNARISGGGSGGIVLVNNVTYTPYTQTELELMDIMVFNNIGFNIFRSYWFSGVEMRSNIFYQNKENIRPRYSFDGNFGYFINQISDMVRFDKKLIIVKLSGLIGFKWNNANEFFIGGCIGYGIGDVIFGLHFKISKQVSENVFISISYINNLKDHSNLVDFIINLRAF